ncbi:MAG: YggT family protein [SAR324 cluster bacterium]|nr:YggT family protein [SAR324 cluster bacterium]
MDVENLIAIKALVRLLIEGLTILILIRVVLSWVMRPSNHPLYVLLIKLTEPILSPLRRIIPHINGIDISPMLALLLLQIIDNMLY